MYRMRYLVWTMSAGEFHDICWTILVVEFLTSVLFVCFFFPVTGEPQGEQVSEGVQLQQGTAGQVIYQPQYVEGSPDPSVYAASNGQMYAKPDQHSLPGEQLLRGVVVEELLPVQNVLRLFLFTVLERESVW